MTPDPSKATRPIDLLGSVCDEIVEQWDKGQRSGKLLSALSGSLPKYRQDVTAIRDALIAHDSHKALIAELCEALGNAVLHFEYAGSGFIPGCRSDEVWNDARDSIIARARSILTKAQATLSSKGEANG